MAAGDDDPARRQATEGDEVHASAARRDEERRPALAVRRRPARPALVSR